MTGEKYYRHTRKFSSPTGGFFLAPAEGCTLRLQQKGRFGPKVTVAAGRPDRQTDGGKNGQTEGRADNVRVERWKDGMKGWNTDGMKGGMNIALKEGFKG